MNDFIEAQPEQPMEAFGRDADPAAGMILAVLRRRWKSIVLVTLVTSALSISAIWTIVHPKYEVSAVVHVAPVVRPILFSDTESDISRQYRPYIANEIQTIQSQAVVFAALNTPEVASLPAVMNASNPTEDIQERLEVEYVNGTHTMMVSMVGENAEDVVIIINTLLEKYLSQRESKERDWDDKILKSLREELARLQGELDDKNTNLRNLADKGGVGLAGGPGDESWVFETKQSLMEIRQRRALLVARLKALDASAGADGDATPERTLDGFTDFLQADPEWHTLTGQIQSLKSAALDDDRRARGPDHPEVRGRSKHIAALQEELKLRESDLRISYRETIRRRLHSQMENDDVTISVIEKALAEWKGQQASNARQVFAIEGVRHERERLEHSINQVRQKIWNVEVEQRRMARVTVESPAIAPERPNKDKRMKFTAIAGAISLILGIGVAVLRHFVDTSVNDPVEITSQLGMSLLGSVEFVQSTNGSGLMCDDRVLEPIRGISTALLASAPRSPSRSRLITSPTAQSGKSSLALNLAQSLASTGRRVLLVDADNRGRGLTRACGMEDCSGLRELFEGQCPPKELVRANGAENLSIIPAGQRDAKFGEMLGRHRAQADLRQLFQTYEDVIVDSPPVLVGSNAVVLATLVDEVILILRAGHSTRAEARAAREYLATVGDKLAGVILNGVDPSLSYYARYGYEYAGLDG